MKIKVHDTDAEHAKRVLPGNTLNRLLQNDILPKINNPYPDFPKVTIVSGWGNLPLAIARTGGFAIFSIRERLLGNKRHPLLIAHTYRKNDQLNLDVHTRKDSAITTEILTSVGEKLGVDNLVIYFADSLDNWL